MTPYDETDSRCENCQEQGEPNCRHYRCDICGNDKDALDIMHFYWGDSQMGSYQWTCEPCADEGGVTFTSADGTPFRHEATR